MNGHPDPERISSFMEGDLPPSEMLELGEHLERCAECAALLGDLEEVRARARSLPERLPGRDLWPEIAQAIQERTEIDPDVIRLHPGLSRPRPGGRAGRVLRVPVPHAVAAGLVLALFSGLLGARLGQGMTGNGSASLDETDGPAQPAWVRLVGDAQPALEERAREVAGLERALSEHREEMDSLTAAVLERNLAMIDGAIQESLSALQADPGNQFLRNHLERAILAKGDYLREASLLMSPIS
jgi:anti-sigma factor RsiW